MTGSYSASSSTPPISRVENNVNVATGNWTRFTQQLASGYTALDVSISGGNGDADLYINYATPSTTSTYQCRPYKNGNNENCNITAPQAGTWYIDIYGYSAVSGMTLSINAQ